ncbi:MAG: hypothetical protein R2838_00065 [Caldilineaceae bacterium]
MTQSPYRVRRGLRLHGKRNEIYTALKRATAPLTDSWDRLCAGSVGRHQVQPGQGAQEPGLSPGPLAAIGGHQGCACAAASVASARADLSSTAWTSATTPCTAWHLWRRRRPSPSCCGTSTCPFIDGIQPPYPAVEVPGGGLSFDRYLLPALPEMDEFVSVALLRTTSSWA